jgi:hypothetical protein
MMKERLAGWPAVDRLMSRLAGLTAAWAALREFSRDCVRGDPAAETIFLDYERDASGPPARTFGEHGIRLWARFDRGDARLRFPSLSVAVFGDEQLSRLNVEGPPTPEFRALEDGIWTVIYQEVKRFERENPARLGSGIRAGASIRTSTGGPGPGVDPC